MTQEDKELLLKDLCARLPYGVKVQCEDYLFTFDKDHMGIGMLYKDFNMNLLESPKIILSGCYYGEDIKPYLFPLSSMTKEQYKEWCDLEANPLDEILTRNANGEKISTLEHHLLIAKSLTDSVNYCYKNHFDIYGLIPKGLAIDATGLNVY